MGGQSKRQFMEGASRKPRGCEANQKVSLGKGLLRKHEHETKERQFMEGNSRKPRGWPSQNEAISVFKNILVVERMDLLRITDLAMTESWF